MLVPDKEAYELVRIFDELEETESHTSVADAIVIEEFLIFLCYLYFHCFFFSDKFRNFRLTRSCYC